MAYITTQYDYTLKQEVFKVSGEKGYSHTTDTILKRLTQNDGTFKPFNTELRDYYTVEFSLNVLRDIGTSNIAFYDNGNIIPFSYKLKATASYGSEVTKLSWTENMGMIYVQLKLTYEVEHNIHARYLGNSNGLPSRSLEIPVYSDLPEELVPSLSFMYNNVEFSDELIVADTSTAVPISVVFNGEYTVNGKRIYAYVNGSSTPVILNLTDSNGVTTFNVPVGASSIRFTFEKDKDYIGLEQEISTYIGTIITLTPTLSKYIIGQGVTFNAVVTDYKGNPIANKQLKLKRD